MVEIDLLTFEQNLRDEAYVRLQELSQDELVQIRWNNKRRGLWDFWYFLGFRHVYYRLAGEILEKKRRA